MPTRTPTMSARRRRLPLLAALGLLLGTALIALPSGPASAAPCLNCDPGDPGGGPTYQFNSTLTVTSPSAGTVASAPAGISCPSTCSKTDRMIDDINVRPTDGWPTYTLTASGGPIGFSPAWTGCDSVSNGACVVTNDAPSTTVSMAWVDTTDPSVSLNVSTHSGKVGTTASMSASASDNAGMSRVEFFVDGILKTTDTSAPYTASIAMDGYADGTQHVIGARAYDTAGNQSSTVTQSVTVDKTTHVTLGDLPDVVSTISPLTVTVAADPDAATTCTTIDTTTHAPVPGATLSDPCTSVYAIPFTPETPDGDYEVRVSATDDVGNTATSTRAVTVDNTAPDLTFTQGPTEGSKLSGHSAVVAFSSQDAHPGTVACTYDGTSKPCTAEDPVTLAVTPGSHVFAVTSTDQVGNQATATLHFTGASAAPTPTKAKTATTLKAHAAHKSIKRHHRMKLIAVVKPGRATGKVVFTRGKHTLCKAKVHNGRATCRTKKLGHGKVHVVAHYLGTSAFKASKARFTFRVR